MEASRVTHALTAEVQHAAYFLYRERTLLGLPGAPEKDWQEAERRLRPNHIDVLFRAYYIYLERERSGLHGDALSDWLEAETTEVARRRAFRIVA